mgnify:CR=1 FL=1
MEIGSQDTFFLDSKTAEKYASELRTSDAGYQLQCCYYSGEKLESHLPNLFHLPLETLVPDLAEGRHRIPTAISYEGCGLSAEQMRESNELIGAAIKSAAPLRESLNSICGRQLLQAELDFSEPLRFLLQGHVNTRVMRHVSENIGKALQGLGQVVYFRLQHGTEDNFYTRDILDFNPHVTININYLNHIISEDVFNFVWIQDALPWITDQDIEVRLRSRDRVFHLTHYLGDLLLKKDIYSSYQPFCIDHNTYKNRSEVSREDKIVVIGSSYISQWAGVRSAKKLELCKIVLDHYLQHGYLDLEGREILIAAYSEISSEDMKYICDYVERDLLLKQILSLDLGVPIEIYGYDWELDSDFMPHYKGVLAYGESISRMYNSAKYTLVLGGYVLQQRTLEAAASGTIPLVLRATEAEDSSSVEKIEDHLVFFNTPSELPALLGKKHNPNLDGLVARHTYDKFATEITSHVGDSVGTATRSTT